MSDSDQRPPLTCGLIMPISAIDSYSFEHWAEVKSILVDAVESIHEYTFSVKMVSGADDIGVIQKRIVQNVYDSDIVVCDVSGKNPNVMFELGMRLAFDKPTVIVKDDKTDYSFDTGVIEHVPYPKDLRFAKILAFKSRLVEKVTATYKISLNDPEHSTFLKNFGKFKVSKLSEDEVSPDRLLLELMSDMRGDIALLRHQMRIETTDTSDLMIKRRNSVRAKSDIGKSILSYLLLNGSPDLPDLEAAKIQELKDFVENELPAQRFFSSKHEFSDAFYEALIELGGLKAEDRTFVSSPNVSKKRQ